MIKARRYKLFLPFCGIGLGGRGFVSQSVRIAGVDVGFKILGGVDNDAVACRSFARLTGVAALCADIATLTPWELDEYCNGEVPDVVFMSPPCKSFSQLTKKAARRRRKYRMMNLLALQWVRLMFATWRTEKPRIILLENVPGIATLGRALLRKIRSVLRANGYIVSPGETHDCGEIGALGQHRRRYLLVARLAESVPALLYQPIKRRLRSCGEILAQLPLPGDRTAGPMHQLPKISTRNWIRLSLIRPGHDWHDLEELAPERSWFANVYTVDRWDAPSGAVTSGTHPSNGGKSVADPRVQMQTDNPNRHFNKYAVESWNEPTRTVIGATRPGSGALAVSDIRLNGRRFRGSYGVLAWHGPADTVKGNAWVTTGMYSVADLRVTSRQPHTYGVLDPNAPSHTISGTSHPGNGPFSIADARLTCRVRNGAYGVIDWHSPSPTITGSAQIDNGAVAVADPRVPGGPALALRWFPRDLRSTPPFAPVLPTEDGSWHRPLTTLELGLLQGLPAMLDGEPLVLEGSTQLVREHIGNAVPEGAAAAIAREVAITLAHADAGTWALSSGGEVWVDREHAAVMQ